MSETTLHSSHPYHTTESAQNYLEAILMLSEQKPVVRSVDVANELGYKKSSISIAMKNLRENNLITVTPEGYIYLTDEGLKIASTIYERHKFFPAGWRTSVSTRRQLLLTPARLNMTSARRALRRSSAISQNSTQRSRKALQPTQTRSKVKIKRRGTACMIRFHPGCTSSLIRS